MPNPYSNLVSLSNFEPNSPKIWQRALAFTLDILLVSAITLLVIIKFLLPQYFPDEYKSFLQYVETVRHAQIQGTPQPEALAVAQEFQAMLVYTVNATILMFWAYFFLNGIFFRGSSLGKRTFRLTVVDTLTYMPLGFFQNLARSGLKAATLFYLFPIPFLLNYLILFFNKNQLAGHDYICRTRVVEDSDGLFLYQSKLHEGVEEQEDEEL